MTRAIRQPKAFALEGGKAGAGTANWLTCWAEARRHVWQHPDLYSGSACAFDTTTAAAGHMDLEDGTQAAGGVEEAAARELRQTEVCGRLSPGHCAYQSRCRAGTPNVEFFKLCP